MVKWRIPVLQGGECVKNAENLAESLMNEVFTIRTTDIQKANFFANRSKKD